MNKYKIPQMVVILLLVLIVFGFSIYYAISSYNEALDISSYVTIKSVQTWSVAFDSSSFQESANSVEGNVSANQTTIVGTFDLVNPGDFYEFTINVENSGNLDAILDSLAIVVDQNDYLDVTVKYGNVTYLTTSNSLNIPLDAGDTEEVYVKIAYKEMDQLTSLPVNDTNISVVISLGYQSVI